MFQTQVVLCSEQNKPTELNSRAELKETIVIQTLMTKDIAS